MGSVYDRTTKLEAIERDLAILHDLLVLCTLVSLVNLCTVTYLLMR